MKAGAGIGGVRFVMSMVTAAAQGDIGR